MSESDPLRVVGQTIAEKYKIEKAVGVGGFAIVYRAQHTIWKQPVAIKFFNGLSTAPVDQRDQLQQDFINEGALLSELSSHTANIVQARDVGSYTTPDGQWMPYMVLEWLEGESLEETLVREQNAHAAPWSLEEVCRLIAPAASALELAHKRGIAHRDIKPANLFIVGGEPRSEDAKIKVLDFGVAKMMADNTQLQAALAKTGTNITSFTPQYGAPEQFTRSYGATGPWTDVFALALVAVEMLVGHCALDGGDLVQLAFSSSNPEKRPTPRALGVDVPDAVEAVFAKALAPRPPDRYDSAGAFWAALESAAGSAGIEVPRMSSTHSPSFATGPTQLPKAVIGNSATPVSAPTMPASSVSPDMLAVTGASTTSPQTLGPGSPEPVRRGRGGIIAAAVVVAGALVAGGVFLVKQKSSPAKQAPAPSASAAVAPPAPAPPATCPKDMAKIPAGQFFMGSDQRDAFDNEKPSHNVKLDAFCMDLYEVTMDKYKACSDVGKCRRAPEEVEWPGITDKDRKIYSPLCNANHPDHGNHPVNCVTWKMADTYCKAQGKELPTEAQWEYATRGPDGRVYPWGDDPPTAKHLNACGSECMAWGRKHHVQMHELYKADDGYAATAPVGSFPLGRSRFGPFDVVGNVWEWTADWYGPYKPGAEVNPTGPKTGDKRVIRGGAFNGSQASWLRPSFRYAQDPTARSHGIGFRCAKRL